MPRGGATRSGSTEVQFVPRTLRGGDYRFDIGAVQAAPDRSRCSFRRYSSPWCSRRCPRASPYSVGLTCPGAYLSPTSRTCTFRRSVKSACTPRCGFVAGAGIRRAAGRSKRRSSGRTTSGASCPGCSPIFVSIRGLSAVFRDSPRHRPPPAAPGDRPARGGRHPGPVAVEEDSTARAPGTVVFLAVPGRAGSRRSGAGCSGGARGRRGHRRAPRLPDERYRRR